MNWTTFTNESYHIDYLDSWQIIESPDLLFYAKTSDSPETFFTVIKQREFSGDESLNTFVEMAQEVMLSDTLEIYTGYNINEVVFDSERKVYSGEYFTTKKEQNYVIFFLYTLSQDNFVIDVSFKTKSENLKFKKSIFNDAVYNIME